MTRTHLSERHIRELRPDDKMLCGAQWAPNVGFSWNPEPYLDHDGERVPLKVCPECMDRYENDPSVKLLRAMGGYL